MTKQSKSYADSYKKLEIINQKLQNEQNNPDLIDQLASMLEEASTSYVICKERIEEAQKFMKEFENKSNDINDKQ